MKKILFVLVVFQMILAPGAFCAIAKIAKVKGDVFLRTKPTSSWEEAKPKTKLGVKSEIKTAPGAKCFIIFDKAAKNVLSIEENSHIKIENIKLGKIILNQGRVFSRIGNIKAFKKSSRPFQIRTTTAIVGVTGTGFLTESKETKTSTACFEGEVSVTGLDTQGNEAQSENLAKGFKVDASSGAVGQPAQLIEQDYVQWNVFYETTKKIGTLIGGAAKAVGGVTDGARKAYEGSSGVNPFGR
ncbi:MAG: FecR domain-containing protein [Candidatus Omnitrophica bacterium]|nr:FecR domain-containing protein [Candidatus Omnitrophota bacterium]